MSSRGKGTKNRTKCMEELARRGYRCSVVEKTGKFVKEKDMFGLFDIVAIKPDKIKFIQVKSNKMPTYGPFRQFASEYPMIEVEIWVWKDRVGWLIKTFDFTTLRYNPK